MHIMRQKRWISLAAAMAAIIFGGMSLASAQEGTPTGLKLSGDQPVQIEGDQLEVLEDQGKAVFDGNVKVVQGPTILRTGRLEIFYSQSDDGDASSTSTMTSGASDIERLEAYEGVNIQSEDQVATGDEGSYDMKSETLVLTGKQVTLSQGGNVATGCKLTVNTGSGRAKLEGCGQGGQRPTILLQPDSVQSN